MQYKTWLGEWLENYVKPSAKQKTYIRYREIIARHITPEIGSFELHELTPLILQRFASKLTQCGNLITGAGLAANSVNGIITVIKSSLKCAVSSGLIAENPSKDMVRPKIYERQVKCFTVSEQKRIEREAIACKKPKMFGVVLCLYTGLRIGELLALQWSDLNFSAGTISVSKTCHDGKDLNGQFTRIIAAPKTQSSNRIIPIPRQLYARLSALKRSSDCEFLISSKGAPPSIRAYQKSFERLLKKLKIEHKGFHALRHTFATRAIECGMDVKTLSEILGHKNPAITLKRYVHSLMEHKKEMMNKLGKLLVSDE